MTKQHTSKHTRSTWVSTHHIVATIGCGQVATGWHTLIRMAMTQAGSLQDEVRDGIGNITEASIALFEWAWAWLGLQQAHTEIGDAKLGTSHCAVGV